MMRGVQDPKNIGLEMNIALKITHVEKMSMKEMKEIAIELEEET